MRKTDLVKVQGTHQENTLEQMHDVALNSCKSALMADGHLGYVMPIGGVAATYNSVSPVRVGFDIACGNLAIKTNLKIEMTDGTFFWENVANAIKKQICFGMGGINKHRDAPTDHFLFNKKEWNIVPQEHRDSTKDRARIQLGTTGGGNHYVDVFEDECGWIWVGVHFGSRGLGHGIATGFLNLAQGQPWKADKRPKEVECLLSLDNPMGQDYWTLMNLAGEYAQVGREWVAEYVVNNILEAEEVDRVHNHHNFAWKEQHCIPGGTAEQVVVTRKGATPAYPGQRGFVGGSMGDNSVILQGVYADNPGTEQLQRDLMYSTVHGAGRVMSRSEAKGNRSGTKAGKVTQSMMDSWIRCEDVILRGGDLDEAPQVYRRLNEVIEAQEGTVEVLHTLKPKVVVMAERSKRW